jgi:hypothetical protein
MEAVRPTHLFLMKPSAVMASFGMAECVFCAINHVTGTV